MELLSTASYYENALDNVTALEDYRNDLRLQIPSQTAPLLKKAAEVLIERLDEHGYLTFDPLRSGSHEQRELLKKALRLVQALEPAGVSARSLQECYRLQIERMPTAYCHQLLQLLKSNPLFTLDTKGDSRGIMDKSGWNEAIISTMTQQLNTLSMHPVEGKEPVALAIPELVYSAPLMRPFM